MQSAIPSVTLTDAPYTAAGLLGTHQVVSYGDTGMDDNSCYMSDSDNGPVPRSTATAPVAYPSQRVLIQYAVLENGGGDEYVLV